MKRIELERWQSKPEQPRRLHYVGQRTAQEVFEELRQRLDNMGYLPDEYFDLYPTWEDGKEIPKGADIFCVTDYGESEGIYLDVYLKWFADGRPVTQRFITGKTLEESGDAMDRMYLIASAITKAFHGEQITHSRYIPLGERKQVPSGVLHLSDEERRTVIDALVARRNQLMDGVLNVEHLLHRVTGSITEYVNEMGQRPLQISDYDMAVLAIQDGNIEVFKEAYPKVPDRAADLLGQAAGRPGAVGWKMTLLLMDDYQDFSQEEYLAACEQALRIGDRERTVFLMEQAESHVQDMTPAIYGEIVALAYDTGNNQAAGQLLKHCTQEQIAAAPTGLLLAAAFQRDEATALRLIDKGINGNDWAADIIRELHNGHCDWLAEHMISRETCVNPQNFSALKACIDYNLLDAGKLLLDQGMDYERFQEWAKDTHYSIPQDAADALTSHLELKKESLEAPRSPDMGGMTLG